MEINKGLLLALLNILLLTDTFSQIRYTDYVNPFIGTAPSQTVLDEIKHNIGLAAGNTNVGARVPWGLASANPRNAFSPGAWEKYEAFSSSATGYVHGDPYMYGISHFNLNGVGCSDWGSILTLPTTGFLQSNIHWNKSTYSHEMASPGYYGYHQDYFNTKVEVTATERTTLMRLTYEKSNTANFIVDLFHSQSKARDAYIEELTPTTMSGWVYNGGFCGTGTRQKVYFHMEANAPATEKGIIKEKQIKYGLRGAHGTELSGFWKFNVQKGDQILVKTGISLISIDNARENLYEEQPDWDFDRLREAAEDKWESQLSKIKVEGGSDAQKTNFYTALYHNLIHPSIAQDVNGEYLTIEDKRVEQLSDDRANRYTVFSLWDTYRTTHPLLTLVYPEQQLQMVRTMVDHAKEHGELTFWELAANESYIMIGDPANPVIADTYLKGLTHFDADFALQAMVNRSSSEPEGAKRLELDSYLDQGYLPLKNYHGSVATSLEYYYADWCIAELANELGEKDLADEYYQRAKNYKLLYDKETEHMRPKLADGSWLKEFNPDTMYHSVSLFPNGGPGFIEGNSWQWSYFVPHDMKGLQELMGKDVFLNQLRASFEEDIRFVLYNQPDMAYPFLFNYVEGQEWRTQKLTRKFADYYFNPNADGIPGNDDAGTLSGWYVFAAMGFYPDCPGSTAYQLTSPIFDKITIELDQEYYPGKQFVLETRNNSDENVFIQSMTLNDEKYQTYQLDHKDIVKGGKLIISLSNQPRR